MQFVQQINTESNRRYFYLNAMDKYNLLQITVDL